MHRGQAQDFADAALVDEPFDVQVLGLEGMGKGFHEGDVILLAGRHHFSALAGIDGQRFFAQDVFAGFGSADSPVLVQVVRQGVVDGLDIRIAQEFVVAAVGAFDIEVTGKLAGVFQAAAGYGLDSAIAGLLDAGGHDLAGDAGAAQDTPF